MTRPVVAAFDLDGTIAERDTLVPFLRMTIGMPRLCAALGRNAVGMVRAKLDRDLRDAAKEKLLVATIGGMQASELREIGERYAPTIALNDAVVARLRDHQLAGHETVVISASPTVYVDALARRLDIDAVVATELEVVDGCVTGRFAGANCRADEKRRRLEAWLGGTRRRAARVRQLAGRRRHAGARRSPDLRLIPRHVRLLQPPVAVG